MLGEYRDLVEKAETLLTTSAPIEEVSMTQKSLYLAFQEMGAYNSRSGDLLGVMAYRLRKKMRTLCPDTWLTYL